MIRTKIRTIALAFAVFITLQVQSALAQTTALQTLASSMQPGTWAQLVQTNINSVLGQGSSDGNRLPYSNAGAWDNVRLKMHFVGADHSPAGIFYMSYDAGTNSWTDFGTVSGVSNSHGFDHTVVDPNTGTVYLRQYGDGSNGSKIYKYPLGGPWSFATQWIATQYVNVAIGTAWWTGSLTGAGANGALMVYQCGAPNGQVLLWNPLTNTWFADIAGFGGASTYHCFAEYSPVHNVGIFGGGNSNPRKVWRLNSDRTITPMPDAPVNLGIQMADVTVDPVTGNFLIMGYGQLWEFDPRGTGQWTLQSGSRTPPSAVGNPGAPNVDGVISFPVSNFGVVAYVTCRVKSCNFYLYRHALSGSPAAPPPSTDTTSPTVSITAPGSGSTATDSTTVSATASDNVGVLGVQFKLDGQNLGSEVMSLPYLVSWNTTTASNASHILTAVARDAAGNLTTSAPITFTVYNAAAPAAGPSDFATRCAAPGVIRCVGFDQASDIAGTWGDNHGILTGNVAPQLDTAVRASGNSSLKFTIPPNSGSDPSGSYFTNFSDDLSVQFGENSDFYIQWRQRFSPELITTRYQGAGGWKQSIIGTGDKPGCTSSTSANGKCYSSCSTLETVTQNTYHRGYAQMYNSCTGSTSHGSFSPFEERYAAYDFKLQNGRPAPYCLYSQAENGTSFPPTGNCFGYFPNEWMTFQVRIKTGPRVNDEWVNSFVELWIAREGQPSEMAFNWGPYNLSAGSAAEDQRFGKIWLLAYNTGKDFSATYPTAYTWYDDLIISRNRIADPGGTTPIPPSPPTDTTAPTISGVSSSSVTTSGATINWTTNETSDSQVEYGTTTSYGSQTTLNPSLVTSHSQALSGLSPGTPYNYRVKSRDAAGNIATSANFTFTTTTAAPSGDSAAPTISITGPANGSSVSSTVTVTATASDNVGVVGVQFKLDGVNLGAEDTTTPYSISWTTTTASNGSHTLTAVARDAAGNQASAAVVTVTVNNTSDKTAPTATITGLVGGSTISGTVTLSAMASDNVGVAGVQFKVDGTNIFIEDTVAPFTVSWSTTGIANGTHSVTAVARDAAGNQTTATAVSVTVNNTTTPPTGGGGGTPPPIPPDSTTSFTIPGDGGQAWLMASANPTINVAHASVQPDKSSAALSGLAIYGLRINGVLVSETSVQASSPVTSGRIYAQVGGPVNTGVAFSNPTNQPLLISFYFTDIKGVDFGAGSFSLPANSQTAAFLNEAPFNGGSPVEGTFTFTSPLPVGVIALRGFTNERNEFLVTTLPVSSLIANTTPVVLPQFADGGGWSTQIVLTNPSDTVVTEMVQFFGPGLDGEMAPPLTVPVNGTMTTTGYYVLPPRATLRLVTGNGSQTTQVGSVRITPMSGFAPKALAIFSLKTNGITVSEAGVAALPTGSAFSMYVEVNPAMGPGSVESGVAIANSSDSPNLVNLDVFEMDGSHPVHSVTVSVPANGQLSRFIRELFPQLPTPFRGYLKVTSGAGIGLTGIRSRYNERGDFLFTTTPPTADGPVVGDSRLVFPHLASGAGYSTEFILFGSSASGRLTITSQNGLPGSVSTLQRVR